MRLSRMWLGTGRNLALWLLWSYSHTQAGGLARLGVLSEAREWCSNCREVLQRGWCLRRLALGLHPRSVSPAVAHHSLPLFPHQ